MLKTAALLLLLIVAALPVFAEWEACPTTCRPPVGIVSGLSGRPLYAVPVTFGAEVMSGGVPVWTWTKTANFACTPAQMSERSDAVACAAKVGEVLMRTPRVRPFVVRATALALASTGPWDPELVGPPRHCPLRLPDSAYTADEREQCDAYLGMIGLETGPRVRRAKN